MAEQSGMVERQKELERQLALLQRHVEQQDKEMLTMSEKLRRVEQELQALRNRTSSIEEGMGGDAAPNERPPHY